MMFMLHDDIQVETSGVADDALLALVDFRCLIR